MTTPTLRHQIVILICMAIVTYTCTLYFQKKAERAAPTETGFTAPKIAFDTKSFVNDPGNLHLTWESTSTVSNIDFEIQEATKPDFSDAKTIYTGIDESTYITGLLNGTYYFRARLKGQKTDSTSPWSETLETTVQHQSISKALKLCGIGLLVVISICAVIVHGTITNKDQETPRV